MRRACWISGFPWAICTCSFTSKYLMGRVFCTVITVGIAWRNFFLGNSRATSFHHLFHTDLKMSAELCWPFISISVCFFFLPIHGTTAIIHSKGIFFPLSTRHLPRERGQPTEKCCWDSNTQPSETCICTAPPFPSRTSSAERRMNGYLHPFFSSRKNDVDVFFQQSSFVQPCCWVQSFDYANNFA